MATIDYTPITSESGSRANRDDLRSNPKAKAIAQRTAFVARFILLRENRRTKAHRQIEAMVWDEDTTAEDLYEMFRKAFQENGDKLTPVDRDLRRALEHAYCSIEHFVGQYLSRSTLDFKSALDDYQKSNSLLFGDEDAPKPVGWRF